MASRLISIVGIDTKLEEVLRTKGKISTIKQFYDASRTAENRKALAELTGVSLANIANWAVQAELLRNENMTGEEAFELLNAGIYSVEELNKMDSSAVSEKVKRSNPGSRLTEEKVRELQNGKIRDAKEFSTEFLLRELVAESSSAPGIYSDLSEIIAELGKGIAEAQRKLDESSIAIQNQILSDDRLYEMGLQATWYAMPEAEFTMKMDYAVTEERSSTGQVLSCKILAVPANASYNNYFKSERQEQSTVRLRFVPIPAADRLLERIYMPDLGSCTTLSEIDRVMHEARISSYHILPKEASDWGDMAIVVKTQTPVAGTLLLIGADTPTITVVEE